MKNFVYAMMMSLGILSSVVVGRVAHASDWVLDTDHSQVGFSIRHMMVSNVKGHFAQFSGNVMVDEKDLTKSTVSASIDVASLDTGNAKRDAHLKSPDFFDAVKFPTMTFKSTKVEKDGAGLKITGDLTIHGITKSVVLAVTNFTEEVKDMMGMARRGASATCVAKRKDFGLIWNKVLDGGGVALGDDVMIQIDVEMMKKPNG